MSKPEDRLLAELLKKRNLPTLADLPVVRGGKLVSETERQKQKEFLESKGSYKPESPFKTKFNEVTYKPYEAGDIPDYLSQYRSKGTQAEAPSKTTTGGFGELRDKPELRGADGQINAKYSTGRVGGMFLGAQLGAEMGKGEDPMFRLGAVLGGAIGGLFIKDAGEKIKYEEDLKDWSAETDAEIKRRQTLSTIKNRESQVAARDMRIQVDNFTLTNKQNEQEMNTYFDNLGILVNQLQNSNNGVYFDSQTDIDRTTETLRRYLGEYFKGRPEGVAPNLTKMNKDDLIIVAKGISVDPTAKTFTPKGSNFTMTRDRLGQAVFVTGPNGTIVGSEEYLLAQRDKADKKIDELTKDSEKKVGAETRTQLMAKAKDLVNGSDLATATPALKNKAIMEAYEALLSEAAGGIIDKEKIDLVYGVDSAGNIISKEFTVKEYRDFIRKPKESPAEGRYTVTAAGERIPENTDATPYLNQFVRLTGNTVKFRTTSPGLESAKVVGINSEVAEMYTPRASLDSPSYFDLLFSNISLIANDRTELEAKKNKTPEDRARLDAIITQQARLDTLRKILFDDINEDEDVDLKTLIQNFENLSLRAYLGIQKTTNDVNSSNTTKKYNTVKGRLENLVGFEPSSLYHDQQGKTVRIFAEGSIVEWNPRVMDRAGTTSAWVTKVTDPDMISYLSKASFGNKDQEFKSIDGSSSRNYVFGKSGDDYYVYYGKNLPKPTR